MKTVSVANLVIGKGTPLTFILGPCVIESRDHTLFCAEELKKITDKIEGAQFIFKASYDKANRSSIHSYRGPGIDEGLKILQEVKETFSVPVTSDIHNSTQALAAKEVLDVLQVPAFLCRQTDLLVACAKTGKPVNVKKGQFLAPWDMKPLVEKLQASGATDIILTDRGTSFGYNNLVTDFRAIPIMQDTGYPVCFDASHSIQLPGGLGEKSGGQREFIPHLAKAAVAAGANLLFIECHPKPEEAKCDAASVYPFDRLEKLLSGIMNIYRAVEEC